MKRLLAYFVAAALLVAAGPAFAGIAIINGGGTGGLLAQGSCANGGSCPGSNQVTSAATTVDVPVGSLVFIFLTNRSGTFYNACGDSAGNTYTGPTNKGSGGSQEGAYCWAITTIDLPIGSTFNGNAGSTNNRGIQVAAFSGAAASPLDAASATPTSGTGGAQNVGPTGTLSCPGGGANCEVLIAAWTNHTMGSQSAQTAGFTNFGCLTTNTAGICSAYEIVSATTAQSYTSTNSSSDVYAMFLEAFTASTGGGTNKTCTIAAVGGGTC